MATQLGASVFAVPMAWYLVRLTVWVSMSAALGMMYLGTLISLFIPENLPSNNSKTQNDPSTTPLLDGDQPNHSDWQSGMPDPDTDIEATRTKGLLHSLNVRLLAQLNLLTTSPLLIILILTFFANSLGLRAFSILFQYVSSRFSISLSTASLFIPLNASVNFFVLFFVLSALMHVPFLAKLSTPAKVLRVAQCSLLLLILGLLGIGLAPRVETIVVTIVVYALGAGYFGAVRSFVTSMVRADQVGQLYGILGIVDTAGSLVSGPVLSAFFGLGMRLGGLLTGLPFLFKAGLYSIVVVVLWSLKARPHWAILNDYRYEQCL